MSSLSLSAAPTGDKKFAHKKGHSIAVAPMEEPHRRMHVYAFNASTIPEWEDLQKSELRFQDDCNNGTADSENATHRAVVAVYERFGEQDVSEGVLW